MSSNSSGSSRRRTPPDRITPSAGRMTGPSPSQDAQRTCVNQPRPDCNRSAMDDDGLVARVAAGDDTALRELFSRHAPWLAARLRAVLPRRRGRGRPAGDVPRGLARRAWLPAVRRGRGLAVGHRPQAGCAAAAPPRPGRGRAARRGHGPGARRRATRRRWRCRGRTWRPRSPRSGPPGAPRTRGVAAAVCGGPPGGGGGGDAGGPAGHGEKPRPPGPAAAAGGAARRRGGGGRVAMSDMDAGPPPGAPAPWDTVPADVDLGRVWTGVAAEVWRRRPGPAGAAAGRLLRSPGLARALVATPSLLLGWIIATVVVLVVGVAATLATGTPYVALCAPAVAAAGIAYAYGPGIDPAWELSPQHGGQRPDGAAGPGAGRVRAERGAGAGRLGRVGGRGGAHLRLAGPDDRGLRAGAGRRDAGPVGERGRGGGRRRLGDHGPGRRGPPSGSTRRRSPIPPWSFPTWPSRPAAARSRCIATRIPRGTS